MKIAENGTYTPSASVDNRVQWLKVDKADCSKGDKFTVSGIKNAIVMDDEIKVYGDFVITVLEIRNNEMLIMPTITSEGEHRNATGMYLEGMELTKL